MSPSPQQVLKCGLLCFALPVAGAERRQGTRTQWHPASSVPVGLADRSTEERGSPTLAVAANIPTMNEGTAMGFCVTERTGSGATPHLQSSGCCPSLSAPVERREEKAASGGQAEMEGDTAL